jgi:hydroxymethylpyrimidine pyrophosphatase-like HAD family hydrolase
MFSESGFSIAVKNAPSKVKRAASYITDSVLKDGAAKAIEKFLLKNH